MSDKDNIQIGYSEHYSEEGFWSKLKKYAIAAGRKCVELALQLYYSYQSPETPRWAKGVILGALGYFISPLDAVPDLLPGGYVDDYGVIFLAVTTVAIYITDEMKDKAKREANKWFGEE